MVQLWSDGLVALRSPSHLLIEKSFVFFYFHVSIDSFGYIYSLKGKETNSIFPVSEGVWPQDNQKSPTITGTLLPTQEEK